MAKNRSNRQQVGHDYENRALALLKENGLRLLSRNFLCRSGEIDLILTDADVLVFVEVRYRTARGFGNAAATVTATKQQRITRTAQHFLAENRQHRHRAVRFDVVAIDSDDEEQCDNANWIKDAFRPGYY